MASCAGAFCKWFSYHGVMKADLRISVKDYSRDKNPRTLLTRTPSRRGGRRGYLAPFGEASPNAASGHAAYKASAVCAGW